MSANASGISGALYARWIDADRGDRGGVSEMPPGKHGTGRNRARNRKPAEVYRVRLLPESVDRISSRSVDCRAVHASRGEVVAGRVRLQYRPSLLVKLDEKARWVQFCVHAEDWLWNR